MKMDGTILINLQAIPRQNNSVVKSMVVMRSSFVVRLSYL